MKHDRRYLLIFITFVVFAITITGLLIWMNLSFRVHLREINNQLTYLTDTNSILQNEVGSMQANFRATLQEESSLLADYSFVTNSVSFRDKTYTVKIRIVPKDYTDETNLTVYFGTKEYPLERIGTTFTGEAVLPLAENYDGNVTVLVANGGRRSTEVLKEYVGYPHAFENVLSGNLGDFPTYKGGVLQLPGETVYHLNGKTYFQFENLELVVQAGETTIYEADIIRGKIIRCLDRKAQEEQTESPSTVATAATATAATATAATATAPVKDQTRGENQEGVEGIWKKPDLLQELSGSYEIENEFEVLPDTRVRIFLRAKTKEGYTFEYELFSGKTQKTVPGAEADTATSGWQESEEYLTYSYQVRDAQGNLLDPKSGT